MKIKNFIIFGTIFNCLAASALNKITEPTIANYVREYSQQGDHLTGSYVDNQSAFWLQNILKQNKKLKVSVVPFYFSRVIMINNEIKINKIVIQGFPAFDGNFTAQQGIVGRLGLLGDSADILVLKIPVDVTHNGNALFDKLRFDKHYKAIIALTQGNSKGLALLDNLYFPKHVGLPVLQVSSDYNNLLINAAKKHEQVKLIVWNKLKNSVAYTIYASYPGLNPKASPIVVSVPRSAWTPAAGEHGASVACWLALANTLPQNNLYRPLHFVAFSGHEIAYLGFNQIITTDPQYFTKAYVWVHLGTNIGGLPLANLQFSSTNVHLKNTVLAAAKMQHNIQWYPQMFGEPQYLLNTLNFNIPIISIFSTSNKYYRMAQDTWNNTVDPEAVTQACQLYSSVIQHYANNKTKQLN